MRSNLLAPLALSLLFLSLSSKLQATSAAPVLTVASTPIAALQLGLQTARQQNRDSDGQLKKGYSQDANALYDQIFSAAKMTAAARGAVRGRSFSPFEISMVALPGVTEGAIYKVPLAGFVDLYTTVFSSYVSVAGQNPELFTFNSKLGRDSYTIELG